MSDERKNLVIIDEDVINQFLFLVYYVSPTTNSVRIILDDGTLRFWLKREKFLDIMSRLLNDTLLVDSQRILFRIRESLNSYGKLYYFDRLKNDFKELNERVEFESIRPNDLLAASRENLIKSKIQDNFKEIHTEYDQHIDKFNWIGNANRQFNKVMNIIRKQANKKKKPYL